MVSEEKLGELGLSTSYYTLKNNIENPQSSVFIAAAPTLDQIERAATSLASNFHVLTKNQQVMGLILFSSEAPRKLLVINPATGSKKDYASKLQGDMSESRAKELLANGYDAKAALHGSTLLFNEHRLQVYSNEDAREAVVKLIKSQKLGNMAGAGVAMRSQAELKAFILKETKQGGKLDFFTSIKGHEHDGGQIKPGLFTTLGHVALYKWGRSVYQLGIDTVEDAYAILAEFQGQPLSSRDQDYLKSGFDRKYEK